MLFKAAATLVGFFAAYLIIGTCVVTVLNRHTKIARHSRGAHREKRTVLEKSTMPDG